MWKRHLERSTSAAGETMLLSKEYLSRGHQPVANRDTAPRGSISLLVIPSERTGVLFFSDLIDHVQINQSEEMMRNSLPVT